MLQLLGKQSNCCYFSDVSETDLIKNEIVYKILKIMLNLYHLNLFKVYSLCYYVAGRKS